MLTIAALMELRPGSEGRTPPDSDFGRAARALRGEGIRVLVAGPEGVRLRADGAEVEGWEVQPDRWARAGPFPLEGVFNRLPSRGNRWQGLLSDLAARGVPAGNPAAMNQLALDKLTSLQRLAAAGLPVPPVEHRESHFARMLERWGACMAKPRYGSFGRDVQRVTAVDEIVAGGPRDDGPLLLQRAIDPPPGPYRGICVRSLCQRAVNGEWRSAGRVARVSRRDFVANVSRGARGIPMSRLACEVEAAADLDGRLAELERGVVDVLLGLSGGDAGSLLEVGVDWVVDRDGEPWLIEINGKPGGRLRVLAELPGEEGRTWQARHQAALIAPFLRLAALENPR